MNETVGAGSSLEVLCQTHVLKGAEMIGLVDGFQAYGLQACRLKTKVHWCSPRITFKVG